MEMHVSVFHREAGSGKPASTPRRDGALSRLPCQVRRLTKQLRQKGRAAGRTAGDVGAGRKCVRSTGCAAWKDLECVAAETSGEVFMDCCRCWEVTGASSACTAGSKEYCSFPKGTNRRIVNFRGLAANGDTRRRFEVWYSFAGCTKNQSTV